MKGFTLFFSMLVASLSLAIGLAIYDITVREINLSSAATQSQYAMYASDTGAECALYWDSKYVGNAGSNSAFSTSTADTQEPTSGVNCYGQDIVAAAGSAPLNRALVKTEVATAATTTFWISLGGVSGSALNPCAMVTVAKSGNPSITTVNSRGYNTCQTGALQLERAFQVSY